MTMKSRPTNFLERYFERFQFHPDRSRTLGKPLGTYFAITILLQVLVAIFMPWQSFTPPSWISGIYEFLLQRNMQLICISEKPWAFKGAEYLYASAWIALPLYCIPIGAFIVKSELRNSSHKKISRSTLLLSFRRLAIATALVPIMSLPAACIDGGGTMIYKYQLPAAMIGQFLTVVTPYVVVVMTASLTVIDLNRFWRGNR